MCTEQRTGEMLNTNTENSNDPEKQRKIKCHHALGTIPEPNARKWKQQ